MPPPDAHPRYETRDVTPARAGAAALLLAVLVSLILVTLGVVLRFETRTLRPEDRPTSVAAPAVATTRETLDQLHAREDAAFAALGWRVEGWMRTPVLPTTREAK